ncbi:MAG TPA: TetR/AcrR family transcriptional regulator [Aggregatilineaceae bacterium]|nr:TetR/AcrR family transcriptional regulator [Aggregatilineaceae bacterium]
MPRPRFNKLSTEKKERILEAAAKEFAAHGYEGSSLNRILEQAGISKGAAYYYFDDKPDLFKTIMLYYSESLLSRITLDITILEKDTFWTSLAALFHQMYGSFLERPWIFSAKKVGGNFLETAYQDEELRKLMDQIHPWVLNLIRRGQTLGLIRDDLPDDLLIGVIMGVDDAHDRWLMSHYQEFSLSDLDALAQQMVELLKRVLSPN